MHVVFEAAFAFEVTVHLIVNNALGQVELNLCDEVIKDSLACLAALLTLLTTLNLFLEALFQFSDRVVLAGNLSEVVVSLGKLALLDCKNLNRDLSLLALVVTTEEN